jgi:2-dehydropantoate 2-reductase
MTGGMSQRLERIETLWRNAGFNVKAYEDINQLVWEKFICNVTFSGTCTVFNRTISQVMSDPLAWRIALQCGLEAHRAGVAKGVYFSFDDVEAYITKFGQGLPNARPSMLLDHLAKRRSEIDVINGAVPAVAEAMGTASPYNEVITALVKAREEEFS